MQEDHSRQCITALVCEVPAAAEGVRQPHGQAGERDGGPGFMARLVSFKKNNKKKTRNKT